MRKQVFGRKFKRDTNERKALFKSLASSLVMYERIETTEEKAKAIRGHVEKMVTKVNSNKSEHARRLIQAYLTNEALAKMMTDIAPRFTKRPGGYTRILKTRSRFSDDASMAIIEWVDKSAKIKTQSAKKSEQEGAIDEVAAQTAIGTSKAKAKKGVKSTDKKDAKKSESKKTKKKEIK